MVRVSGTVLLAGLVWILAVPRPAPAQSPRGPGSALYGQVLDNATQAPVPDATVLLRDTTGQAVASAVSDSAGRFRIGHPGRGDRFRLHVRHVAFAASEGGIRFPPGEQVRIEVLLARQAIELEPILVRDRRRSRLVEVGFYARQARGLGVFVDRDEIDRRRPGRITDLLRGRAGIRVVSVGLGQSDVRVLQQVSFQYRPEQCQPAVWVDGGLAREGGVPRTRAPSASTGRPLSAILTPEELEGVEVFTGTAGLPSEFAGSNAPCGVILLWTRPAELPEGRR